LLVPGGEGEADRLLADVIEALDHDDLAGAEHAARDALALDPPPPEAMGLIALVLLEGAERSDDPDAVDRLNEAETFARQYLAERPDEASGWDILGGILQARGDAPGAAEAYRSATERAPDQTSFWLSLADLQHRALGAYNAAEQSYRKALALAPDDPIAWHGLASLLEEHLGRTEDADAAWRAFRAAARRSGIDA